jgi:hypothetical protein
MDSTGLPNGNELLCLPVKKNYGSTAESAGAAIYQRCREPIII